MAINVICPGCMTRFQVSDQFAGKKGPCPKCGHIIEIPKENLVVHSPEDLTSKRTAQTTNTVRPISKASFNFTTKQLVMGSVGVAAMILVSFLLSYLPNGMFKYLLGGLGVLAVGFPLTVFGYTMIRDPEDLEMFLGHELHRRSAIVSVGFAILWFGFEYLLLETNPGFYCFLYVVPLLLLASFLPLIFFDTTFQRGVLVFLLFAFPLIFLRGLYFAPEGWIWVQTMNSPRSTPAPTAASLPKNSEEPASPEADAPANDSDNPTAQTDAEDAPAKAAPPKKTLSKTAPDPSSRLRRQR